ncbi:MAG: N-glycosyltransferase [Actinomycetia bacterium]|nr:N-glycosyltransferase [Actinomycetes bacterium]
MTNPSAQPRIRGNDYGALLPAEFGRWEPTLSVSVVIPAYGSQHKLDLTLAALTAQTYPGHLLEVVISDDGSDPPLRLPEIRPEHTRIVPSLPNGWGCAHAYRSGALAAEGDVIVRLDADMICFHDNVEAQVRWHHLADHLVVVGHKRFVDYQSGALTSQDVHDAVARGDGEKLFDAGQFELHPYETFIENTDLLRTAGAQASRIFTGASASYHRAFYHDAGGVDGDMILGEDTEFGYRLGQAGGVFIPELASSSWHLGWSTTMTDDKRASRYCQPFYANRVLIPRTRRPDPGRQWKVAGVEAVVDVAETTWERARATVSGLASGLVSDVHINLVGPWSKLQDGRRDLHGDPLLDLRLMREGLSDDGRVYLVESVAETAFPAPYRFHCPAGWVPTSTALRRLIQLVNKEGYGLVTLELPGEQATTARFEQTRAYARARRVAEAGDEIDDVVREMFGAHTIDGTEWALTPAPADSPPEPPIDWQTRAEKWESEAQKWQTRADSLNGELRDIKVRLNRRLHRRIRRRLGRLRRRLMGRSG